MGAVAVSFQAARDHFEPLSEIWLAQSRDPERTREWIYIGVLSAVDARNRGLHGRGELRRIPVSPRPADELVAWIKTGPGELNRALDGDLPDDIGWSIKIEERYPSLEEVIGQ